MTSTLTNKARYQTDLLCNHLSRLLGGKVPNPIINGFVEKLLRWDFERQVDYLKRVSAYFLSIIIDQETDGLTDYYSLVSYRGDNYNLKYLPNSKFFKTIINYLDRHPNEERDLLSGLTGLHTVAIPYVKPSSNKVKEIELSISQPRVLNVRSELLFTQFREYVRKFLTHISPTYVRDVKIRPITEEPSNKNKRVFYPNGSTTLNRDISVIYDIKNILEDKVIYQIFDENPTQFFYFMYGIEISKDDIIISNLPKPKDYPFIGNITLLPSPKGKYRPIAIPQLSLLTLNYPLSHYLKDIGHLIPHHGIFDHDQAARQLVSYIDGNKTFYSIDYSSFTDNFPYQLQRIFLEESVKFGYITDFEVKVQDIICNSPYKFNGKAIKYAVGTPQGTYASFPLASLCHILLSHLMWTQISGKFLDPNIPSMVIGDDSVIWDDRLYNRMSETMAILNTPIQKNKTLCSKKAIEFCSKIIMDKVYLMKKIKPINNLDAYIRSYRYYNGNLKVPKRFQYVLKLSMPFGILDYEDTNERISNHFEITSYLAELGNPRWRKFSKGDYKILFMRTENLSQILKTRTQSYNFVLLSNNFDNNQIRLPLNREYLNNVYIDTLEKECHDRLKSSLNKLHEEWISDDYKDLSVKVEHWWQDNYPDFNRAQEYHDFRVSMQELLDMEKIRLANERYSQFNEDNILSKTYQDHFYIEEANMPSTPKSEQESHKKIDKSDSSRSL